MSCKSSSSGGCCTWPIAIGFALLCVLAGVLSWQLPDWDGLVGSLLPDFTAYTASPTDSQDVPTATPSEVPTVGPVPFSECNNANTTSSSWLACCNGLVSNCARSLTDLAYATSHNAMSSVENSFSGPNHLLSMEKSLGAGYRAFLLDLCDCGAAGLRLCHSLCAAGTRDARVVLGNVLHFLNNFPTEVVLLEFQMGRDATGKSPIAVQDLYDIFTDVPGLVDMLYVHTTTTNTTTPWPTLRTLIDDDTRLVVFHHSSSECGVADDMCPPGMHYYFQYAVETSFAFSSATALETHADSCSLSSGSNGRRDFYNLNHFVTRALPDARVARQVNQRQVLERRIDECEQMTKLTVNLVAVDFWSLGQLPSVVQDYNRKRAALVEGVEKEVN